MAKKMALVPAEMLNQLKDAPLMTQMSALDEDMGKILQHKQMSTDLKFRRYQDALQRYQGFVTERDAPSRPPPPPPETFDANISKDLLLPGIPQQKMRNAKLLADFIKNIPELSVTDRNEIRINGETIANSNIIDLFADLTRDRRGGPPPRGMHEFVTLLQNHNVPMEAIGNHKRRETIEMSPPRNRRRRQSSPEFTPQRQSSRIAHQGPRRNYKTMHDGTPWERL